MHRLPRGAFYVLFTVSGFAGLIYESIWTHYLKLFLGHAAYAQSLVLAVFMGGMAAGAALCARLSERIASPLLAYALVEAVIGAAALVFHPLFVGLTDWSYAALLPALGGEHLALAGKVMLAAGLILPQSILLGMTFPLMSAALVRGYPATRGESLAMLYFTNSLGAALGVLASGFVLIGWAGLPGTLGVAGGLNLALALVIVVLARDASSQAIQPARDRPEHASGARLLLGVAFFTGLASFVYEISWIRMLSLVLGASTHSFELMLFTFILGLALGGLAVRGRVDGLSSPERFLGWVQLAMGLLALSTLALYDLTFGLMESLMKGLARSDTGYALFNVSGAAISALVMLPATLCAGMTLPLITGTLLRRGAAEAAIGRVYAANTLGAIAGVVLTVHIGLPELGLKGSLLAGSLIDALLGFALLRAFGRGARPLALAALGAAAAFVTVGLAVELDANKMTAGVFRHGELAASRDAQVLFSRDGKTATVHLVRYPEATSLRTNGKSDGSINLDPAGERGTDEITMVLTGALPLALKPSATSAAVIGIGTGLTSHTLLQSLSLESVETIEIEAAMAQAARGFAPRNSAAFADPRSSILIDDAKTFFSTHNRRYDVLVSEPSNPWVSGVASLFTREFYLRIRAHLNPGGLLVQWFQLYEVGASLMASVLAALGEAFAHYAIFAASDHDVLIVASAQPIELPAQARVFEQPGVARELGTVHVRTAGDLDARYVGSRPLLEPLFASYGMPANSDFAPVLDLNAARHRFTERSATDVVALLTSEVPVLELLDPSRSRREPSSDFAGAYAFERLEQARLALYASEVLAGRRPVPQAVPAALQKDLELVRLRLMECREPRTFDFWLQSALRVAKAVNPYLSAEEATRLWERAIAAPCYATLTDEQRTWLALFRAVGARDAGAMTELASTVLASEPKPGAEARQYLLLAAMAGAIASDQKPRALALWEAHAASLRDPASPALRLLRCHAGGACAKAFFRYAER